MKKQPPFRIGKFIVEPARFCMREGGRTVDVSKRLMQLLIFLAARQGEVVTKDELLQNIWPGVIVSDDTIRKSISDLRILFQQETGAIEIESIRGIGYRLLTPVAAVTAPSSNNHVRLLWPIGLVLALAVGALSLWSEIGKQAHWKMEKVLNQATVTTAVRWSDDGDNMIYARQSTKEQELILQKGQLQEKQIMASYTAFHPEAVFSPDGQELVYLDRQAADKLLRQRNLLTGKEKVLTSVDQTPSLSSLDWSPDTEQIVWAEAQTGRPYQLYSLGRTDTGKEPLTYPPMDYIGDMQARFSPSGDRLCFIRFSGSVPLYDKELPGLGQLYVKDLESGAEIPLLEREMILGGVTWQDEHTLAYIARDFYHFGIHTIDLRTREKQTIHTSPMVLRHLEGWQNYLWTEEWQEHYHFLQFRADDEQANELFPTTLKCWHPAYSPNGSQLAYVTKGEQAYELRLRDMITEKEEVLFAAPMLIQSPQWSPAGDALVFMLEGSESGVCTFELANRKVTPLSKGDYPVWSADGESIIYTTEENGQRLLHRHSTDAGSDTEILAQLPAKRVWPYQGGWLFSHSSKAGLWHYRNNNEAPKLLIPDFQPQDAPNWLVLGDGLYFWTRIGHNPPKLRRFDLGTGASSSLVQLSMPLAYDYSGFAIHPLNGTILFPAQREVENQLLPIALPEVE